MNRKSLLNAALATAVTTLGGGMPSAYAQAAAPAQNASLANDVNTIAQASTKLKNRDVNPMIQSVLSEISQVNSGWFQVTFSNAA